MRPERDRPAAWRAGPDAAAGARGSSTATASSSTASLASLASLSPMTSSTSLDGGSRQRRSGLLSGDFGNGHLGDCDDRLRSSRDGRLDPKDCGLASSSCSRSGGAELGRDAFLEHFGVKLLFILSVSHHLLNGFVKDLCGEVTQEYSLETYHVAGPQIQIFVSVADLPWAMKPVIGVLSDVLPIRGYHKAPYMMFATLLGVFACAVLGFVPWSAVSVTHFVGCLFFMQLQLSVCDLLSEARYAEKMKEKPEHGPALITYIMLGTRACGLMATIFVGPIIDNLGVKATYLTAVIPMVIIIIPLWCNYLQENTETRAPRPELESQLLRTQSEACLLSFLMFAGTLALTFTGIAFESVAVNAVVSVLVALIMCLFFCISLHPILAKVNIFFLVQACLNISIHGAGFYFYTDSAEQFPNGPHFSTYYFTTVLGVTSDVCALVGVYLYMEIGSGWTHQRLLLVANIAECVLNVMDTLVFSRVNLLLGIPDHTIVVGGTVCGTMVYEWMRMPGLVLMSQLCPAGMEATLFALLAGCIHLGKTVGANVGALILQAVGCDPSGAPYEEDQFRHMWVAAFICALTPLLNIAAIPWLVPAAHQTDSLEAERNLISEGGALRRWQGY